MTKKILIISIVSVLVVIVGFSTIAEARPVKTSRIKCDVDMDGKVTRSDATMIANHAIGLKLLNRNAVRLADADNDGRILMYDAALALRTSMGLGSPNCSMMVK